MESSTNLYKFRRNDSRRDVPRASERVRLEGMQAERELGQWALARTDNDRIVQSEVSIIPVPRAVEVKVPASVN